MTYEERTDELVQKAKESYKIYSKDNHVDTYEGYQYIDGYCNGYEQGYEDCRHYAHDYYKPKWHDLRKNPDDLPEECQSVLCLCNDIGYKYYCTGHLIHKTWFSNIVSKLLRVIAWYELPEFKE